MIMNQFEQLHDKFELLMTEYADVYESVKSQNDWKNSFRNVIAIEIPDLLKACSELGPEYSIQGSYGKGRWTAVPWIAVFDTRITTSAQKGVYIVYLLNKDTKDLYLTLEIAATEIMGTKTNSEGKVVFSGVVGNKSPHMKQALIERTDSIRSNIPSSYFSADDSINTGSAGYDYGAIYYKKYSLKELPSGEWLINDLKKMVALYKEYYNIYVDQKTDEWWPALNEYAPGISREQWIRLLNDPQLIGSTWGGILAKFYDYGGAATCSQIAERYGGNPMSVSGSCTQLAKAIQKATDCALYDAGDDRNRYWPILFQGRKADSDEKGSWVWKLRPELKEALNQVNILRYLQEEGEPETQMTIIEAIDRIKSYIAEKGFTYDGRLIENLYLSLKSKPFVILAGTSGTGKTRLVKLFAEAIGANEANGRYKMVSVRPDWSDGSDLFGHTDLNGKFINGPVCSAFEVAVKEPDKPVFLCLDEMNLARVEYYLSDFLSVIESREMGEDGRITTSAIAQYEGGIPDNLYIVGTVNMDETTFPFSKKVLDRANTIEFNYVELVPRFEQPADSVQPLQVPNSFLRTEYLVLERDCADERDYVVQICDKLQVVNEILRKANAHVGYRVRDEIVFYMLNNKKADNLLTEEQAFDNEIMQKILPRIQGSSVAIKDMLVELFKFCMGSQSGPDTDSGKAGEQMQSMAESAIYKESAMKIGYMMKRYEEDGFTSYWL